VTGSSSTAERRPVFDKLASAAEAVAQVEPGSTVLVGGFGESGLPRALLRALLEAGTDGLTVVSNNAGGAEGGLADLLTAGLIRKVICSFPRGEAFARLHREGKVELELVAQGTLAERIRAGAANIGPFYCPVTVGTTLGEKKEKREFEAGTHVLEHPIRGDVALVHCALADRAGNVTYRATARNFNPVMAMAAERTLVESREVLPAGRFLDPEQVVTPSIYVNALVELEGEAK
jgi:3-oxoadipate CoA-transferase, alpha subunit